MKIDLSLVVARVSEHRAPECAGRKSDPEPGNRMGGATLAHVELPEMGEGDPEAVVLPVATNDDALVPDGGDRADLSVSPYSAATTRTRSPGLTSRLAAVGVPVPCDEATELVTVLKANASAALSAYGRSMMERI